MVVLVALLFGFLAGALTTLVVEIVALVLVIRRLNRRAQQEAEQQSAPGISQLHDSSYLPSHYSKDKEGSVWVLEPGKLPKPGPMDKGPGDQKWKKDVIEVTPVRKNAKVKDHSLILTESDGSHRAIQLEGCSIAAVSATSLSSRKWAKRFPIKVESKTSMLYNGSKTMYIYLGTSMEKESWCKALRLASCNDTETEWFSKLCREFQSYLATLNEGHLSLLKPSGFYSGPVDRSVKLDGSSKVRHFLKKIAKKACKSGVESKASWSLASVREGTKINEKFLSPQDSVLGTGVVKTASIQEAPNLSAEEKNGPSSSTLTPSGSRSHTSVFSDVDSDERIGSDEGTLCWNLLASRLFFDAKSNSGIKSFIQARVQRTLSNMRKPSYIGELTCVAIDLGNLPPYVSGMRLLPSDMNDVWAMEFDIQYSGGVVIDVATRLEVSELEYEGRTVDTNLESSPVEEVTSDILEGFEHFGKQLELSQGADGATERMDETDPKQDGVKTYKTTKTGSSSASRWKSIVNSIAKQVSQVPLALAIKVTSLKGTLRLLIKSPPSDHLWFGFTSMPDIDFNLESSVGEHKINSGRIALLLISRFKAAIRENLVLPNCEGVWIPWMLAEKDDWIPREVAPFIWMNQQSGIDSSQPGEVVTAITDACRQTMSDVQEAGDGKGSNIEGLQRQISESSGPDASSSDPAIQSAWSSKSLQELSAPLLSSDKSISASQGRKEDSPNCQSPARSMTLAGEHIQVMEGDDLRPKRVGTRARMLGLGKKMAEKLDEKRRTVEDKGRHIVDRMRGP